jgi:hypothetical protein
MADDLPPLAEQPDSTSIPNSLLQQLQHSSQWAGTFGGSDTNIAERARHNQDINTYAGALLEKRAEAQQNLIQTDQTAQNLYFKTLQLNLQQQQAQQKMQNAAALLPATLQLKQAQIQADQARAMATTHADLLKAKHDQISADDTLGLSQHMNEILDRTKPGTEDYQAGVTRGLMSFPNADKNLQSALLKNAGIQLTPEEFTQQAMAAKANATDAGFRSPRITSFQGKPVIVEGAEIKPPNPDARLSHLESLRMKPNIDEDVKTYLDGEISKLKTGDPATTPAATAAKPESYSSPDEFTSAFKAAPAGAVLHYNGKPYKKP